MLRALLTVSLIAAPCFAWEVRKDSQGDVVRWDRRVEFVIDAHFAQQLGLPDAPGAVTAAAATLAQSTAALEVLVRQGDHEASLGYAREANAVNENSIVVLEDWPYEGGALAVTLVTLNARTNQVLDADIAVNAAQHDFFIAVGDRPRADGKKYDLQNTLTHELGHALGLMHSREDELAVMYPSSAPGETCKRTPASDDIAGLVELYGAAVEPAVPEVGCAAAPGRLPLVVVAALLLLALKRRARPAPALAALGRAGLVLFAVGGASGAQAAEPAREDPVDEISWGEVVATASRWLPDTRVIVTEVEVEVLRCVKGACAERRVKVQVLGGRVGDLEQVVDHLPAPRRGSQVVLTRRRGHLRLTVSR